MPRRRRSDSPGTLHHVFDRGIARRTVFESARDVRYFLALLACEVRAGRIEIIGFAILTTHFHLFVRSPCGELSEVMQRVLNLYVRYFNRTRRRDGPLFRGRFGSKPVWSERYARLLLRYIDQNAVGARLVFVGEQYPYGSARHYVAARRPVWLSTEWVDERMGWPEPAERFQRYRDQFGRSLSPGA